MPSAEVSPWLGVRCNDVAVREHRSAHQAVSAALPDARRYDPRYNCAARHYRDLNPLIADPMQYLQTPVSEIPDLHFNHIGRIETGR
jgi:hypothetical protein